MEKNFIELPVSGQNCLVNVSCIQFIEPDEEGGVTLWYKVERLVGGEPRAYCFFQHFDIPYEEAKRLLGGPLF